MLKVVKQPSKDFVILNLTDMQMKPWDWNEGDAKGLSVKHTITTLVERVKPDLITVTGDIADGYGEYEDEPGNSMYNSVYSNIVSLMDSFRIPWAPVSGNHDHFFRCVDYFAESEYCLFELGDASLGRGNYVIKVCDGASDKVLHGIFMVDTHANFSCQKVFSDEKEYWCNLWPAQIQWYKEKVDELKSLGCESSSLFAHIPIYAFSLAKNAALKEGIASEKVTVAESYGEECWNEGYKNSFGVWHEGVCSPATDDGVFAAIKEKNHTTHVVVGHAHENNAVVNYEGVCLAYGMKTALTTYFGEGLNGGTVLTMDGTGKIKEVHHEYVE